MANMALKGSCLSACIAAALWPASILAQGTAPEPYPAGTHLYTVAEARKLATDATSPAAALSAYERMLDRAPATLEDCKEAHAAIHKLRDAVPGNNSPAKARKWHVLALLFQHLDFTWADENGKMHEVHKTIHPEDEQKIRKSLAEFRKHVFKFTSGILDLDITIKTISEPLTKLAGDQNGRPPFSPAPHLVLPAMKDLLKQAHYDTVMAYVKFNGDEGDAVPAPFTAATYGRITEMGDAGYIMVPWHTNYPYPGETDGEMELHEWLHQMQSVFVDVLHYPEVITANPDGGRQEGDNRPGGDYDYFRPAGVTTWIGLYQHMMQEHYTRNMWHEAAIALKHGETPPGEILKSGKQ
jgi:hypothetical protein